MQREEREEETEEAFKTDLGSHHQPSTSDKEKEAKSGKEESSRRDEECEEAAKDLLEIWDNVGQVEDIPGLSEMPKELRDLFLEYRSVFSTALTKERCMNCEPVKISLREGEAPPSPIYRSKPTPYHWLARTQEILKELEDQSIIVRVMGQF